MAIATYYHCTPTGAGAKNGLTWATAFDEPALEAFLEGTLVAGDVIFIESGTYTLDSAYDWNLRDGTITSPVALIGVTTAPRLGGREGANILYTDWAAGANRPFFDCATFQIITGNYIIFRNLYFQGSANYTVYPTNNNLIENCKFDNDNGASAARYSLNAGQGGRVINCEFISTNCSGLTCSQGSVVLYNYFHDMTDATGGSAIVNASHYNIFAFNVFDNVRVGINVSVGNVNTFINNTFYDTDTSISATTSYMDTVINNICEGNTIDGFLFTTQTDLNFFWKNHGNDARCNDMWDGVDTTTIFQDYAVSTGDPLFATAGSDFSLATTSPNIGNGYGISLGVGAGGFKQNQGAWQCSIDEATRNTNPGIANVKTGTAYKILNIPYIGTLVALLVSCFACYLHDNIIDDFLNDNL